MYDMFHRYGLGEASGSGFTGESAGNLPIAKRWGPVEQATIAYGYGLSLTPLQLARAYAAIADGGILHTPTFVKGGGDEGKRIVDAKIAAQVKAMLETVVSPGSTAPMAAVPNYLAGGKTGTSRVASRGGYNSFYNSVFVGFVPASDPRLVARDRHHRCERQQHRPVCGRLRRRAEFQQDHAGCAAPARRAARQREDMVCGWAGAESARAAA